MQLPIYFFGDNHFSINSLSNKEKIKKFEDFYHLIKNEKCSIVIMGDFFDYYFEYNNSNPDYFNEVFDLLKRIKESKIDIYLNIADDQICCSSLATKQLWCYIFSFN